MFLRSVCFLLAVCLVSALCQYEQNQNQQGNQQGQGQGHQQQGHQQQRNQQQQPQLQINFQLTEFCKCNGNPEEAKRNYQVAQEAYFNRIGAVQKNLTQYIEEKTKNLKGKCQVFDRPAKNISADVMQLCIGGSSFKKTMPRWTGDKHEDCSFIAAKLPLISKYLKNDAKETKFGADCKSTFDKLVYANWLACAENKCESSSWTGEQRPQQQQQNQYRSGGDTTTKRYGADWEKYDRF